MSRKDKYETHIILAFVVFGVLLTAGIALGPPTEHVFTSGSISFDTQPVDHPPENATIYGQSNLTASEYGYLRDAILGSEFEEEYLGETSVNYAALVIRNGPPEGDRDHGLTAAERESVARNAAQADYLDAEGTFYPVQRETEVTRELVSSEAEAVAFLFSPIVFGIIGWIVSMVFHAVGRISLFVVREVTP